MKHVIKLLGIDGGQPTAADGQYVMAYSPTGGDRGNGVLHHTPDLNRAKKYDSVAQATAEWQSGDLRYYSVEIIPVDKAPEHLITGADIIGTGNGRR